MQALSSALERLDVRSDYHQKLSDTYTNTIVDNESLNNLILWSNMVVAHIYRNVLNAAMESRTTKRAKEIYQKYMIDQQEREIHTDPDLPDLNLGQSIYSGTQYKYDQHKQEDNKSWLTRKTECELRIPDRRELIFGSLIFVKLFLLVRYAIVSYALSESFPRKTLLTMSKSVYGLVVNRITQVSNNSISLTNRIPTESGYDPSDNGCQLKLESYLNNNFKDFIIWNSSSGVGHGTQPLLDNFVLIEQNEAVQMFLQESLGIVYLMATFIGTCGLMGNVLAQLVPYDISTLVFAYDPKFVAFNVQARLNHYLEAMRASYLNYWSSFQLAPDNSLMAREPSEPEHADSDDQDLDDESPLRPQSPSSSTTWSSIMSSQAPLRSPDTFETRNRKFQPGRGSPVEPSSLIVDVHDKSKPTTRSHHTAANTTKVVDCVCLNHQQFDDYLPTARSQAWRRFLLITNPFTQLSSVVTVSVSLAGVFIIFVNSNSSTVKTNVELKSILAGEQEPNSLRQIRFDCRNNHGLDIKLNTIREVLVDHLAPNFDRIARGNSYKTNYESIGFKESTMRQEYYEEYGRLLVNSIGPLKIPDFLDWSVVYLGVIYTALLTCFYINIFIFTLVELCFWLIELRMKLNISTVIMKYYEAKSRLLLRHVYQGNNMDGLHFEANFLSQSLSNPTINVPLLADGHLFKPPVRPFLFPIDYNDEQTRLTDRETSATIQKTSKGHQMSECNINMLQVLDYLIASRSLKKKLCANYAARLIHLDRLDSTAPRRTTSKFLVSTYLDFRLFQDQIDDCRKSMNILVTYTVIHSLNIMISSTKLDNIGIKIGRIIIGFFVANLTLIGASFFQSQCSKLYSPIHSILAASVRGDKTVRHLALLWRRILIDLAGARSKFSLRVYSLNISYATTLQFNLTVASLYILTLDKNRF